MTFYTCGCCFCDTLSLSERPPLDFQQSRETKLKTNEHIRVNGCHAETLFLPLFR